MLFLTASILFLGLLSILMRESINRGAAPLTLNFIFRGAVALFLAVPHLRGWPDPAVHWEAGMGLTAIAALSFYLSGLASLKAVQLGPLSATWTILRCAMVLPVLASIFYWGELFDAGRISALRVIGILMALATVVFYGRAGRQSSGEQHKAGWSIWMATAFLSQGAWEICLRATADFQSDQSRALFLLVAFAFSSIATLPIMIWTKTRLRWLDIKWGLFLGVCALLGTGCRVLALRDVPGTVVFPLTTVAVILIAQAAGRYLWGERFPNAAIGLGLGLGAALLLSLT